MKDLKALRREYHFRDLTEADCPDNPFLLFEKWINHAISSEVNEPNAMVLSTVALDGQPSSRVVLLKEISGQGLRFYSNYQSRKGQELSTNPKASLLFFWPELEQQVRIEGLVNRITREESSEYFMSRPYSSQVNAIISPQSQKIDSRSTLQQSHQKLIKEAADKDSKLERPKYWGGYDLIPNYFEFWQGQPNRLNDRISYKRFGKSWSLNRLAP